MRETVGKKRISLIVCLLFVGNMFIPCALSVNDQGERNLVMEKTSLNQSTATGIMTCYTIDGSRDIRHRNELSKETADKIFTLLQELRTGMTRNPSSEQTHRQQAMLVDVLDENGLLGKGYSKQNCLSLLRQTETYVQASKQTVHSPSQSSVTGVCAFCSAGGAGRGLLIPMFLLPRPRIAMMWFGSGESSAANLLTGRGYVAAGIQTGFTTGFFGIGISYAIPGYTMYGFIGYALLSSVVAQEVVYYPLNNAPLISDASPGDGAQQVPVSLSELQFRIQDNDLDLMTYTVTTTPSVGEGQGTLKLNGVYTIPIQGLETSTQYTWRVEVSDGKDTTVKEYHFTTVLAAPVVSNPQPKNGAIFVPVWASNLSFDLLDYQGDLMNWTVETHPDIGSASMTGVGNGRYSVPLSGLTFFTDYTWSVNVTDGQYVVKKTFVFTTAAEGVIAIEPSDDANIQHNYPDIHFGDSVGFSIRNEYGGGAGWAWDALLRFDVSSIPANATIQYAYISLYYYGWHDTNPVGRALRLYRVTSPWDEESVTWNTQPTYEGSSSSDSIVPASPETWMDWNVTADVQAFFSGTTPNHGWKLTDDTPWSAVNIPVSRFHAKEQGDLVPLLVVGFDQ